MKQSSSPILPPAAVARGEKGSAISAHDSVHEFTWAGEISDRVHRKWPHLWPGPQYFAGPGPYLAASLAGAV